MTVSFFRRVKNAINQRWVHYHSSQRWNRLTEQVHQLALPRVDQQPVIFFNASTRLIGVSQNAAYSYLTSLGLQAEGVPVIQFVCRAGMQRCVLGSNRDRFDQLPPCSKCVYQSEQFYKGSPVRWFEYEYDEELAAQLENLKVEGLSNFVFQDLPLGFWAVNTLRWVLRRHNLKEEPQTRAFMQSFILSAWNIYQQFEKLIVETNPQAVVVFNGMFYPEAAVRQACLKHGVRVITHEVGIQPFSAFFTTGEATAYPIDIQPDFTLTDEMNQTLDEYLSHRFSGNFTMAGIRFWPEMQQLEETMGEKLAQYKKIVPIFTNVIFDTSQVHANTLFSDMFQWLEKISQSIIDHPEILFVIRAHPDESREGKASRESVADWVKTRGLLELPNVVFISPDTYLSSYELIQRSHFVMVYNSTIGLEATLLGKAVLAAGKARYTQIPTTFLPRSQDEYMEMLNKFISSENAVKCPPRFIPNARRFLYTQLYLTSLPFHHYLKEDGVWKGYVTLKDFPASDLLPENSETMRILSEGIIFDREFQRKP